MIRLVMLGLALTASAAIALAQSAVPVRLYVFDGGILEYLDNAGVVDPWTNKESEAMQSVIDRLGNCASMYRQSASGYESGDEPILDAILVYVQQARSFLAGGTGFVPHSQQSPTLQQDRG